MKLVTLLLGTFIAVSPIPGVFAQNLARTSLSYETYHTPEAKDYLAPTLVPVKFDGQFEVWYLLGEPVVNCTARWLNNHQLRVNTRSGDTIIANPGEAEIYNLKLVAQLWDPAKKSQLRGDRGGHIGAFCDAGVVAQNGKDGFNVAGSPNWDKFLCELPAKFNTVETATAVYDKSEADDCRAVGGTWFSAEAAKKLARDGLKFEDVRVKSAEVNVNDALMRYEKFLWRQKSFAYKNSKAVELARRLAGQTQLGSADYSRKISRLRAKRDNPADTDLKAFDAVIESMLADLRDEGAFAVNWRERDQALVQEQLTHIRAIEPALLREDARLSDYRQALENRKASEPVAEDPLAQYIVSEHSLTAGLKSVDYVAYWELKDYTGRVVAGDHQRRKVTNFFPGQQYPIELVYDRTYPLSAENGHLYDLYVVYFRWDVSLIYDGQGRLVTNEPISGHISNDTVLDKANGNLVFVGPYRFKGFDHEASAPIVYSLTERRVIFDGTTQPLSPPYFNDDRLVMKKWGNSYNYPIDYSHQVRGTVRSISGRPMAFQYIYGVDLQNVTPTCSGADEDGSYQSIWPVMMYDLQAERLLKKSEFLCPRQPWPRP